jgi:hypothetical protein
LLFLWVNGECIDNQNMNRATVKFDDLRNAFDFVSDGMLFETEAYLCVETGVIHIHSEFSDFEDELPGDVGDSEKYIAIPHKNDLDLGRRLALGFVETELTEDLDDVYGFFRHKGAYARFKGLLENRGKLQQWYEYEENRTKDALRQWCKDNEIETHG